MTTCLGRFTMCLSQTFVSLCVLLFLLVFMLIVSIADHCLSVYLRYEGVSKSFEPQAFSPFR